MYASLLIGFEYVNSKEWKSLPGIPVDLYKTYVYAQKISKNIKVFTDIIKDHRTDILQRAIIEGYVDSNLLSFVEDIKDKHQHILYKTEKINNYNINNFDKVITESTRGVSKLFIYFTGHAKNGHIILPDDTHVSLNHLKDLITANKDTDCQIIVILDCCQSNGMNLPYIFKGNYKLNSKEFIQPSIICLSSSQIDEDSTASQSGSIFTRNLFNAIESMQSLESLYNKIKDNTIKDCTCTIHCSYPEKILWPWFSRFSKNNMNITYDKHNSTIHIVLNNCSNTINGSASISDYLRNLVELNYK